MIGITADQQKQNVESLNRMIALAMKPVDDQGHYEAVIPGDRIDPQFDFMYLIQARGNNHRGAMFPDFNQETPYFIVRLNGEK